VRITGADCAVLFSPDAASGSLNSALDNAVVRVHTEEGLTGIGEVESNPWVIKAFVEDSGAHSMDRSLSELVAGWDATDPVALWDHLYQQTLLTGRRGAGIGAIGAIDIAVWDLAGKAADRPVWQLLGEGREGGVVPYASLLPEGSTKREVCDSLISKSAWARDCGFHGVKAEVLVRGPWAVGGLNEGDDAIVEIVTEVRNVIGPGMKLMVDVGYCWPDWRQALDCIRRLERYDIFFIETPLPVDDLASYRELVEHSPVPVAAGELLTTRFEFEQLMDLGGVRVIQPDVGRVGGITETMRVIRLGRERGAMVVPHCWKSGIGIAATAHVAAVTPECPFIEYLPAPVSGSALRRDLLRGELVPSEGVIQPPLAAGLGIELNEDLLPQFIARRSANSVLREQP
jgi:L-alanine-DL-glutamate epimerase-like enolase superfamily enzyme